MDKQELKDAIKEALRELYLEIESRKEKEKKAKTEARIRAFGHKIPKRAREMINILKEYESLTEDQWRDLIRGRMSISANATRTLWHRYMRRMVAEGWVLRHGDGRYFLPRIEPDGIF